MHPAAATDRAFRHRAHQPDAAAAIDQRHARRGDAGTERLRRGQVGGVGAGTGAAEDGDGTDMLGHEALRGMPHPAMDRRRAAGVSGENPVAQ
jgi:hypothetical protein